MGCHFGRRATTRSPKRLVVDHHLSSPTAMLRLWRAPLSLFLVNSLLSSCTLAANLFENTAIVRTVELGGSLVHVTTTYAVKALEDGSRTYTIALGEHEREKTSWLDVKLKGESEQLALEEFEKLGERYVELRSTSWHRVDPTMSTAGSICTRSSCRRL